jgi:hydrogenase maturation protease
VVEQQRTGEILLVGVGNIYRSDDGAGPEVARRIAWLEVENLQVIEIPGDCSDLLERWKGAEIVMLVDAVASGDPPGTIHRLDAESLDSMSGFGGVSTHGLGVVEAIKLAQATKSLPAKLFIYGITAKDFQPGVGLSPEVEAGVEQVVGEILEEARCTSIP